MISAKIKKLISSFPAGKIKAGFDGFRAGLPKGREELRGWLYLKMSSQRTSVYVLCVMALLYLAGAVFPQGASVEEYSRAGGRFAFLVRVFGLLDFFASPVFLLAALVLFLNLAICTYERYGGLFAKKVPDSFEPTHTLCLTQDFTDALIETRRVLREDMGFRLISKDGTWVVMEKGLPLRALNWLYHAGIALCFAGFALTYLFAFEDTITLAPNEPQTVVPEKRGRVTGLLRARNTPEDFELTLGGFATEYSQVPMLDYPDDKLSRLAIGLGWRAPEHRLDDDSYFPMDWRSRLKVTKRSRIVREKTIEVNDPLEYGGYSFHQEGYWQKLKILVDYGPIPLEAMSEEELIIPGGVALRFGTLRTGTLKRLDGSTEKIRPFVLVMQQSGGRGEKRFRLAGKLEYGGSIEVGGKNISLIGFEELSVLRYRFDPGAWLVWLGGAFALAAMTLRFFGIWHRVAYKVDDKDGIVLLDANIASKGLFANGDIIAKRLEYFLTRNDIKPNPLPRA